ncbi:MAG: protein-arginine deiminase [Deltaproteobacteria bacterium]|nr:protein-arginine deiminase [Deltaproteobacteria bacterium]
MKRVPRALLVTSLFVAACGGSDAEVGGVNPDPAGTSTSPTDPPAVTPPATTPPARDEDVDLRADTNRDGVVRFDDPTDDDGEDVWDAKHGAIFLANIDDDQEKCPSDADDIDLPNCNDAADDVVNGIDDALDLARLATKPWPGAPDDAKAKVVASTPKMVRLFKVNGTTFEKLPEDGAISIADLRKGVELAIEGKDIVRDPAVWDGFVDVTLTVTTSGGSKTDKVRMRVAPLLTSHHLQPAITTYVSQINTSAGQATRSDLGAAAAAAGVPAPKGLATTDQWAQDFFETGMMTMPGPNGAQHVMRVNIRSANETNPASKTNPLRRAGRLVFTALRGKDSAAVQQFDPTRNGRFDTLNSFGNFETIPPYTNGGESFPLGRVLRGNIASYYPDKTFLKMIEAQRVQPPVYVDTSWLLVGHVDETLSFVKAGTPRGWVLLVNDATAAKSMLEAQSAAGNGGLPMFVGKFWDSRTPAQVTIDQVLADTEVMQASAEAAVEVDAQLAILKAATGLTDAEIIRIPYLHMPYSRGSVAYQPGMVNGLYLSDTHFVAPDPHGPEVEGKDIFKDVMTTKLAAVGVTVHYAEDWDLYHRALGEIHCGTNSTRAVPTAKWWESGR